jgi:sn1-specific diacylglycerol lipase
MHSAANYIYHDIFTRLADAFDTYPDYKLVICGYSLGAGIGAILAILLKSTYPDLKCYGIAMPGSVLSENLAQATRDFIVSYVFHVDMIARSSIRSLSHLRDRIIDALTQCHQNKVRILTTALVETMTHHRTTHEPTASRTSTLLDNEAASVSLSTGRLDFNGATTTSQLIVASHPGERPTLVLPGTIVHLCSTSRMGLTSSRSSYSAFMSTYDQFSQLIVHPRMWFDHFPASYSAALQYVIDNYDAIAHEQH